MITRIIPETTTEPYSDLSGLDLVQAYREHLATDEAIPTDLAAALEAKGYNVGALGTCLSRGG